MRLVEELNFGVSSKNKDIYEDAIEWVGKYILKQGPLEYFVHHNTLHAFESRPFVDALFEAKSLFQAQTHMPLKWFVEQLHSGRITQRDLDYAIQNNLGPDFLFPIIFKWTNENKPLDSHQKEIFLKRYLEKNKLRLKNYSNEYYQVTTFWDNTKSSSQTIRLKKNIQDLKFKFLSAFFDKGTAYWEMEDREYGFGHCFETFVQHLPQNTLNRYIKTALSDIRKNSELKTTLEYFQTEIGIPDKHIKNYLFQILNEIKGWSGLVFAINENSNFNPTEIKCPTKDYILFCLIFELAAYRLLQNENEIKPFLYNYYLANSYQKEILSYLYDELLKKDGDHHKVQQTFEKHPEQLFKLDLKLLIKIWQEAYEAHLYFDLINHHAHQEEKKESQMSPRLQVITCIDDREESTRRHFEEYDSSIMTYGYAGHFGLNIKYRSLRDAHFRSLCPLSVNATKYVFEEVLPGEKLDFKTLAKIKYFLFHNANLPFIGSFLSLFLGPFTGMLFLFENIAPKTVHRLRKSLKKAMFPPIKTQLNFRQVDNRELEGFTEEELAQAGLNMLSVTGINKVFAKVIYICGHGSKSMNNPHGAAYNCGACSGGKGAPNARLMATALNDPKVRNIIRTKGVDIPHDTLFVGGYHCTSTGKLLIFDKPESPNEHFDFLNQACRYVEAYESKERMRKFENVSLNISPKDAFVAAQNRSYDFSQPRPEYGHNTNAYCLVGNRKTSKDLFLDRRGFLVSYESENDPSGDNLLNLLSAVIPVCAGINLEYYFSFVDQEKFGAGVKQAHNVTSLMGVMNGYQSDLQMGLPWQMVEIHEPARITFLIEASKENFDRVLEKNKEVRNLVRNQWVLVILKTPDGEYLLYRAHDETRLTPNQCTNSYVDKSSEVYEGKRDILPITVKGDQ